MPVELSEIASSIQRKESRLELGKQWRKSVKYMKLNMILQ